MTGDVIATTSILPVRDTSPWRLAIAVLLTALADWLFFGHVVGISLALFVVALGVGVFAANKIDANRRAVLIYSGILAAAVLPLVEDINVMSVSIAILGLGCFALGVTAALRGDLKTRLIAVGWFLVSGPFQVFRDLPRLHAWVREIGALRAMPTLRGWIIPLACGAVFVALFAAANPLIANFLTQLPFRNSLAGFDTRRLAFWAAMIVVVWGAVCACGNRFAVLNSREPVVSDRPSEISDPLFNEAAVRRSLVLFNLLFAVQTGMDINYLWRGAALPDGMSYASYAHRGAYPLIATALLAAVFVILALRPGSRAERSPTMRALVFLWIGQNVLLVVSSILRLDLYVAVYSLTYWRVAAFIWMLVVAAGLVLIVVRIMIYRSNAWLISANLVTLTLTIYVCSVVNFPNLMASYNVAHMRDMASAGQTIDLRYLATLGPQAIPALDQYAAVYTGPDFLARRRDYLAAAHMRDAAGWRSWTFRGWRLTRYLEGPAPLP